MDFKENISEGSLTRTDNLENTIMQNESKKTHKDAQSFWYHMNEQLTYHVAKFLPHDDLSSMYRCCQLFRYTLVKFQPVLPVPNLKLLSDPNLRFGFVFDKFYNSYDGYLIKVAIRQKIVEESSYNTDERDTGFMRLIFSNEHTPISSIISPSKKNVVAFTFITEAMKSLAIDIVQQLVHRSAQSSSTNTVYMDEKALQAYCHLHHLLIGYVRQNPIKIEQSVERLVLFTRHKEYRIKQNEPDLTDLLVLMLVAPPNICFPFLKKLLYERLIRDVKWAASQDRSIWCVDDSDKAPKACYRINRTFQLSRMTLSLFMFHALFYRIVMGDFCIVEPKKRNSSIPEEKEYESNKTSGSQMLYENLPDSLFDKTSKPRTIEEVYTSYCSNGGQLEQFLYRKLLRACLYIQQADSYDEVWKSYGDSPLSCYQMFELLKFSVTEFIRHKYSTKKSSERTWSLDDRIYQDVLDLDILTRYETFVTVCKLYKTHYSSQSSTPTSPSHSSSTFSSSSPSLSTTSSTFSSSSPSLSTTSSTFSSSSISLSTTSSPVSSTSSPSSLPSTSSLLTSSSSFSLSNSTASKVSTFFQLLNTSSKEIEQKTQNLKQNNIQQVIFDERSIQNVMIRFHQFYQRYRKHREPLDIKRCVCAAYNAHRIGRKYKLDQIQETGFFVQKTLIPNITLYAITNSSISSCLSAEHVKSYNETRKTLYPGNNRLVDAAGFAFKEGESLHYLCRYESQSLYDQLSR